MSDTLVVNGTVAFSHLQGNDNADYGVKAYLQKVRLVEMADNLDSVPAEF